jgi:2-haloacid dehalogenase
VRSGAPWSQDGSGFLPIREVALVTTAAGASAGSLSTRSVTSVVFDLGNVLIEWNRDFLYRTLIPDVERRAWFLENITNMEWNAGLDRGRSFDEAVAELSAKHPEWMVEIEAFRDRWVETMGDADAEAVALVAELRDAGVPVYALTNWSAETFPHAQARFEWLEWFDGIIVSGHEGVAKPEPAIFELLHERFGIELGSALFTDDLQGNIDGARAAGLQAELWTSARAFRSVLQQCGAL